MATLVSDPDFTLHVGDALDVLRSLPAESVHCCVTSPPYWGLRDYGTGTWVGGDADCDHRSTTRTQNLDKLGERYSGGGHKASSDGAVVTQFKDSCGKCGARRVDHQLGLEPTPDEYVANMVDVFREVRRVLRADGTLWLNIGDSYNANQGAGFKTHGEAQNDRKAAAASPLLRWGKPKDLVGIPWRLAFALQADGWYLRSDIIWAKPNPMPESVTDRPTKAHEYLFLLSKSPRYFYDLEAIREPIKHGNNGTASVVERKGGTSFDSDGKPIGALRSYDQIKGANRRSVWEIATEAYPDAHFATFPQALVEPCVKAGCPEWVCGTCGKPRERISEETPEYAAWKARESGWANSATVPSKNTTLGWTDCGHNNYQPGVVLDPFLGSGTTAQVARRLGRRCLGIELNPEYAQLAARRLQQQSLFACVVDESAGQADEVA